jgi:hypothetical protein
MISAFVQGINPVLPLLFILIVATLSLLLSWWTYSHMTSIPAWKKWSLISLRAASLSVLAFLLFNPFSLREYTESETPAIAVYLDNSESLTVERGEYRGLATYTDIINRFRQDKDEPEGGQGISVKAASLPNWRQSWCN